MNVSRYEMRDGALPPEEQLILESESGNRHAVAEGDENHDSMLGSIIQEGSGEV